MKTLFVVIAMTSFSLSRTSFGNEEKQTYKGIAKAQNGDVLYIERHEVIFNGPNVRKSSTKYFSPDEKQIAILDSDYTQNEKLPTYIFRDLRSGYEEGVERTSDSYQLFFKDPGQNRKSASISEAGTFASQGWHYYLVQHLSDLERGNIKLNLALPGKLDVFAFELTPMTITKQTVEVRLQVSSWIIRMFAPSLNLLYDKVSKHLIRYRGVSNILDEKGKTRDVEINYEY